MLRRLVLLALILLPVQAPPVAAAGPAQPRDQHRALMDAGTWPFTALGRLNAAGRGFCTAVLVGPSTALTAGHCLFNPRTGALRQLSDIHVVAGFQRDTWLAHARAKAVRTDLKTFPRNPDSSLAPQDWAVIDLDAPIGRTVGWLGVRTLDAAPDAPLFEAGYRHDRPYAVSLGSGCAVLSHGPERLMHDCTVQQGGSGSPLLQYDDGRFWVVGLNVMQGRLQDGRAVAIAAPAAIFAAGAPAEALGKAGVSLGAPAPLPKDVGTDTGAFRTVLASCLKADAPLDTLLRRRLPAGCIR